MAKKRNVENQAENDAGVSAGDSDPGASATTPRLSVTLDDKGRIAWDRMRPETTRKLREAIGDIGPKSGPAAAAKGESFPPALCEVVYDSLGMLLVGLARRGGYSQEQAGVLVFSADEKRALVPATIKVLDKYDASLGKYQEEIMLGILLTTIVSGKLTLLKKAGQVIEMTPRASKGPESTVFSPSQPENRVL